LRSLFGWAKRHNVVFRNPTARIPTLLCRTASGSRCARQDAMGHADLRTTRRYDRARHVLHRDPALRLGARYADRAAPPAEDAIGDGQL
jgi:hypothetical protein